MAAKNWIPGKKRRQGREPKRPLRSLDQMESHPSMLSTPHPGESVVPQNRGFLAYRGLETQHVAEKFRVSISLRPFRMPSGLFWVQALCVGQVCYEIGRANAGALNLAARAGAAYLLGKTQRNFFFVRSTSMAARGWLAQTATSRSSWESPCTSRAPPGWPSTRSAWRTASCPPIGVAISTA